MVFTLEPGRRGVAGVRVVGPAARAARPAVVAVAVGRPAAARVLRRLGRVQRQRLHPQVELLPPRAVGRCEHGEHGQPGAG